MIIIIIAVAPVKSNCMCHFDGLPNCCYVLYFKYQTILDFALNSPFVAFVV